MSEPGDASGGRRADAMGGGLSLLLSAVMGPVETSVASSALQRPAEQQESEGQVLTSDMVVPASPPTPPGQPLPHLGEFLDRVAKENARMQNAIETVDLSVEKEDKPSEAECREIVIDDETASTSEVAEQESKPGALDVVEVAAGEADRRSTRTRVRTARAAAADEDAKLSVSRKRPPRPVQTSEQPAASAKRSRTSRSRRSPSVASVTSVASTEEEDLTTTGKTQPRGRGKKRRPPLADAMEAAPIIDASEAPAMPLAARAARLATLNGAVDPAAATRECEFCSNAIDMSTLLICSECRRAYHSRCLVSVFKPFVATDRPIAEQFENLKLNVPDRRANLLRCAACRAVYTEFAGNEAHLEQCSCPTCQAPEKLVTFRRRKLLQMLVEMNMQRDEGKRKKGSAKQPPSAATTNQGSNQGASRRKSVRPVGRLDGADSEASEVTMATSRTSVIEGNDTSSATRGSAESDNTVVDLTMGEVAGANDVEMANGHGDSAAAEVESGHDCNDGKATTETPKQAKAKDERAVMDNLLASVNIVATGESTLEFPIVCTDSPNVRTEGFMRSGIVTWSPKLHATVTCQCCSKKGLTFKAFVRHCNLPGNDSKKKSSRSLFVQHRDDSVFTPYERFVKAVRWKYRLCGGATHFFQSWCGLDLPIDILLAAEGEDGIKNKEALDQVRKRFASSVEDAFERVRAVMMVRRNPSSKISLAIRDDASVFQYLLKVVALESKYLATLPGGVHRDRLFATPQGAYSDRKVGWLTLSSQRKFSKTVYCECGCEAERPIDKFLEHAGLTVGRGPSRFTYMGLYVMESGTAGRVQPFSHFCTDTELLARSSERLFDAILEDLQQFPAV